MSGQGRVYGSVFTPNDRSFLAVPAGAGLATQQSHVVDTSGAPQSLTTLSGMNVGDKVTLQISDASNALTITSVGNIASNFNERTVLSALSDYAILERTSSTLWAIVAVSVGETIVENALVGAGTATGYARRVVLDGNGAPQTLNTFTGPGSGAIVHFFANPNPITIPHGAGADAFSFPLGVGTVLESGDSIVAECNAPGAGPWTVTAVNRAAETSTVLAIGANNLVPIEAQHTVNGGGTLFTMTNAAMGEGATVRLVRGDNAVLLTTTAGANGLEMLGGKSRSLSAAGDYADFTLRGGRWYEVSANTTGDAFVPQPVDGNAEIVYADSGEFCDVTTGGAAPYDLIGVIGGNEGDSITVRRGSAFDMTIQHDGAVTAGLPFIFEGGQPITLTGPNDYATFFFNGNVWSLTSFFLADFQASPRRVRTIRTRVTAAQISAAGATVTFNLMQAPGGCEIVHVFTNVAAVATFGGTTNDLDVQVGIAGDATAFRDSVDLKDATGRVYGTIGAGADVSTGAPFIIATFTAGGGPGVIDEVTGGTWDFYITFLMLPNIAP